MSYSGNGMWGVFEHWSEDAIAKSLSTGMHGVFVEGCTYGVASGLIYIAEALLFYIGIVLVARGANTHLQMVEVLTLILFTVLYRLTAHGFQ